MTTALADPPDNDYNRGPFGRMEAQPVGVRMPSSRPPVFADLITPYLTYRRKGGDFGLAYYRNARTALHSFSAHVGRRPLSTLASTHVESWLMSLTERGYASSSIRTMLSAVRGLFVWTISRGITKRNPAAEVRGPRQPRTLPRALSLEAVRAVYTALPDTRAILIVTLMVQRGLRCCEISRLTMADVDRRFLTMRVVGKGGHERILPIDPETSGALDDYLAEHPAVAGPLVRSYTHPNRALTPTYISNIVSGWMWDAGIKRAPRDGVSAHAGRHTCLTDMLRHGAHLRDVQAAAGHMHLATTEIYLPLVVHGLDVAMGGREYRGVPAPRPRSGG